MNHSLYVTSGVLVLVCAIVIGCGGGRDTLTATEFPQGRVGHYRYAVPFDMDDPPAVRQREQRQRNSEEVSVPLQGLMQRAFNPDTYAYPPNAIDEAPPAGEWSAPVLRRATREAPIAQPTPREIDDNVREDQAPASQATP